MVHQERRSRKATPVVSPYSPYDLIPTDIGGQRILSRPSVFATVNDQLVSTSAVTTCPKCSQGFEFSLTDLKPLQDGVRYVGCPNCGSGGNLVKFEGPFADPFEAGCLSEALFCPVVKVARLEPSVGRPAKTEAPKAQEEAPKAHAAVEDDFGDPSPSMEIGLSIPSTVEIDEQLVVEDIAKDEGPDILELLKKLQ